MNKEAQQQPQQPDTIKLQYVKMRWLDRVIHFFRRSRKVVKGDVVKKAFTLGGRTYYHFEDLHRQPYERALTAIDYYEELRMCTSREFMLATCDAVIALLNGQGGKVDLVKIGQLITQLKQRSEWIYTPDMLYKLASVVFIDMSRESPFTYDFRVATEKITHWKKHKEAGAFFLQMPMVELVPFLKNCDFDFQNYSRVVQEFQRSHLASVSSVISGSSNTSAFAQDLISRIEKQIALGD